MRASIFDYKFKEELNDCFKDTKLIVSEVTYLPLDKELNLSFKLKTNTADIDDTVLTLNIKLYGWYKNSVKIQKIITIINCNNLEFKLFKIIFEKITLQLSSVNHKELIKQIDIIESIVSKTTHSNDDDYIARVKLHNSDTPIEIESYVLYKDDVPYFKLISGTTALISCKVLLDNFNSIV